MAPPVYLAPTPQARRRYLCPHTRRGLGSGLVLDGRLDKPFWQDVPWTDLFVDIEGNARPRPTWATRAKLAYDATYLYVGAELEEPHPWAILTKHDEIVYYDHDFEVFLSPTGDNHRYYELEINALSTVFDLFIEKPYRDGGPADHDFDFAGLKKAVHLDGPINDPARSAPPGRGWSVELAIAFESLDRHGEAPAGRAPRPGDRWRLNFSRVQWDLEVHEGAWRKIPGRAEHNWVWSPQGIIDMHRPEMWGDLEFLPPGTRASDAKFVPEPWRGADDALHRVYYAQRGYQHRHGRWAATLVELGLTEPGVNLQPDGDGWQATAESPAGRLVMTSDSRIVKI